MMAAFKRLFGVRFVGLGLLVFGLLIVLVQMFALTRLSSQLASKLPWELEEPQLRRQREPGVRVRIVKHALS